MALPDWSSLLGLASSLNFSYVGAGIIGILIIIFIIWVLIRSGSSYSGTYTEKKTLRGLGTLAAGLTVYTGRGLLNTFLGAIRGSKLLAKNAYKVGKKGTGLTKDTAKYTKYLITGEEDNSAMQLHQTVAAAAAEELSVIMGKLANSELKDHQAMVALESKMKQLFDLMDQATKADLVDKRAMAMVTELGTQITNTLIELANDEGLEINIRKTSFSSALKLLKTIKAAESLARRIEKKAISNQKSLADYNQKEIIDLEKYLKDKVKEEQSKIKAARDAYNKSKNSDRETKVALYNQIRLAQETSVRTQQNVKRLLEILEQLRYINMRMLQALVKIKRDVKLVLDSVKNALSKEKVLIDAEGTVEKRAEFLKTAAKNAKTDLESMQANPPEQVIISLTSDTGAILKRMIEISAFVRKIDNDELLGFMNSLSDAMQLAFKVEEASRIANEFYAKILKANEEFYRLVVDAELSSETKVAFNQEIQIERMEQRIAASQENISGISKSLFIKTKNMIDNTKAAVVQHIQYLDNNIQFTSDIKDYVLRILSDIMSRLSQKKTAMGEKFAVEAQKYQDDLNNVIFTVNSGKKAA